MSKGRIRYRVSHSSSSKKEIAAEELVRTFVRDLKPIVLVDLLGLEYKYAKKMTKLLQTADVHLIWKEDN